MKASRNTQEETAKSYRRQKSEQLWNLAMGLKHDSMSEEDRIELVTMLERSSQNLTETKDKWMIGENTKTLIKDYISEGFFCLQDAINSIDEDAWDNEWRCDFSNRMMHKSLQLQSFKKNLINAQRTVYNLLNSLVEKPFDYLVDYSEHGFDISEMKFRIVRNEWKP